MGGGHGGPGRLREWVYRRLLWGYPPSFRRRYRTELLEAFRDAWTAEARGRPLGALTFWSQLVVDGLVRGLVTRLTRTEAPVGPFDAREAVGVAGVASGVAMDARHAVRSFMAAPGFALVVVATLGLGIGATTAVFSVVRGTLMEPLPYEDPGRLVRLYMTQEEDPAGREYVTGAHYAAYRDRAAMIRHLAAEYTYAETGADLVLGDSPERVRLLSVTASYFDVLGVAPVVGRGFRRAEERPDARVAVLSEALWERLFASDPGAVGRPIRLSGSTYTVIGVMPATLQDPIVGAVDIWVPQDTQITDDTNQPYNHYLSVIGRLESGVTVAEAQAELDAAAPSIAELYPDQSEWHAALVPLREDVVGSTRPTLYVLLAAVGLLLLVACVNVANLFLVRSFSRRRELAVRSALGSGRGRLARQLLTESSLLAVAGGVVGLLVAQVGVRWLIALGGDTIPRLSELRFDAGILGFTAAVAGATGLVFGVIPAIRSSRVTVADELRDRSGSGGPLASRLRSALVVVQVALALVLLSGAGLLMASMRAMDAVELGFEPTGAVTFEYHLPESRYDAPARASFHAELARRAEALAGVEAAGAILQLPATGRWYTWGTRALTGPAAGEEDAFIGADNRVVEGRVFEALGIALLRGRSFDARDDTTVDRRYVISRETARRLFGETDPIGQQIAVGGRAGEVIGMVGDAVSTVEGVVRPVVYHSHTQFASNRNWDLVQVVRTAGEPEAAVPALRRLLRSMDPELVLHDPRPLRGVVEAGRAERRFALELMMVFALTALGLAALGLYAVLAFAVGQRRHEFGIRMALGATAGRIRRDVVIRGLGLAAIGTAVGLLTALVLGRWVRSVVFEVSVGDPGVLGAVTALVLATAALAGFIPAMRATSFDPRTTLDGR